MTSLDPLPEGRRRICDIPWPDCLALLAIMGWAVVIVRPLFDPGYPSSWDGAAHVVRLKAMADLFLPQGRTDGWCPYWYNGFVPFLFYPNFFFVLAGGLYHVLGKTLPLLVIFKLFIVSAYTLLPPAMYLAARCYRFTRFAALCAALCVLAISAPHGIGIEALFIIGLIPHGFALPLFLLALGAFHLGITLGGRFVPAAAILCALVAVTHLISGVYLALAGGVYLAVAWLRHRRPQRALQRALGIAFLTAGISAAVLLPLAVRLSLSGPGTGWGDFPFFRDFFMGKYLGGPWINWLALAFVVGFRRRRFEETFLVILAVLTLPFALGVVLTGTPAVDNFFIHVLRSRSFAFVGLFVALFAGGAADAIRRFVSVRSTATVAWLIAAALGGLLLMDTSSRVAGLKRWIQVDAHYNTPEKWMYLDAYHWLRRHAPQSVVIGFDDRFKEFGNPGYNQMASRVVLEADRFSLPGNQIEATRAHNAEVLSHLHDWDPARIHQALVRYNVSFLLTWVADIEANLQQSSDFAMVYRNAKVQIWEIKGHDFNFVSGRAIQVDSVNFSAERMAWTITCAATECPITLAVAYHPNWQARIAGKAVSLGETDDHLMQVRIPQGTSSLILVFRRAWWELLSVAISAVFFGLSLLLWVRGRRSSRSVAASILLPEDRPTDTGGEQIRLSVVIPAYNEAGRIGRSLERLSAYLQSRYSTGSFEIIVVDDGSCDGTIEVVEGFRVRIASVRLIRFPQNHGKGAAVRAGMLAARGDAVLFSDADLSTPIEEVEEALKLLSGGSDLVIGSRALAGSQILARQSVLRESMGKLFNRLLKVYLAVPFSDTQCGFKLFRGCAAREIFQRTHIDGFAFDVEAILLAIRLGYTVHEMPVRWINDSSSTVSLLRHPAQMLVDVWRIRRQFAGIRPPLYHRTP